MRAYLKKPSMMVRFGVLTALAFAVFGVVLTSLLGRFVTDHGVANAEESAGLVARAVVSGRVRTADYSRPLEASVVESLSEVIETEIADGTIARFKLWSPSGTVRWSNDDSIIGTSVTPQGLLLGAIGGQLGSKVVGDPNDDHIAGVGRGRLVEAFVPIRDREAGSDVVAIAEVYLPYERIAAESAAEQRRMIVAIIGGVLALYIVSFRVVASASRRLRIFARESDHQAHHDSMTGLPNRLMFAQQTERALVRAARDEHAAVVMMVDLDRFKDVNDSLGHGVGDELLIGISERLSSVLRPSDVVARLGGDEFGVLLPDVAAADDARDVAENILQALDEPFFLKGLELDIGASIGLAVFPDHANDPSSLMRHADTAMYEAKRSGRTFAVYSGGDDGTTTDRLRMLGELRSAIRNDELTLHYQPKVELITGRIHSVEVLLRWQHARDGLIPPDRFVPLAESAGMTQELTDYVLHAGLAQTRAWMNSGVDLALAVNISARNLDDPRFPASVQAALQRHNVRADLLELELTESALIADHARGLTVLNELRDIGVHLAIDDYGTGYSSIAYLRKLPISVLKIDRSFIRDLTTNADDRAIVRSTISMAHDLGLEVVAEGVETDEVRRQLIQDGCRLAQGYLFARPMPADQLSIWLAEHRPTPAPHVAVAAPAPHDLTM